MSEPTHGGRREGAGRPLTTGAKLVPRTIRLTADEWAALDAAAKRRKTTPGRLIAETIRTLAVQEQER